MQQYQYSVRLLLQQSMPLFAPQNRLIDNDPLSDLHNF